ncbi:MAG: hypothetical protein M1840_000927 [Geoglossum simile]|nr:MAG: hypothetical protein M1840_000927 [Geoglossum simile]
MSFQQQGQVDWVAFGDHTKEILSRMLALNIDNKTIAAALTLSEKMKLSLEARKRICEATDKLRDSVLHKVFWFGFGLEHIVHSLAATDGGLQCLSLCSCFLEVFEPSESASILHHLTVFHKIHEDVRPTEGQWKRLLSACSGALATSDFALTAEHFMSLNNDKSILSTTPSNGSFGRGGTRAMGNLEHIAEALYAMFNTPPSGTLNSITISGGSICGWIAAVGYWFLGLTVQITRINGQECVFRHNKSPVCVFVKFTAPENRKKVATEDKTYFVDDAKAMLGAPNCIEAPGGRVRWDTAIWETFGDEGNTLLESEHLGPFIGSTARVFAAFAQVDPGVLEAHHDAFESLRNWVGYRTSSYGAGFASFALEKLPELRARQGIRTVMDRILLQPYLSALRVNLAARRGLAATCNCRLHSDEKDDKNESPPLYCLLILAEAITVLTWALSLTDFKVDMDPNRAGLQAFYTHHAKSLGYFTSTEPQREASNLHPNKHPIYPSTEPQSEASDLHPDEHPIYRLLKQLDIPQLFDTTELIFAGGLSPKPRGGGPPRLASVSGCVCFYLDVLREPSDRIADAALMHVLPGGIRFLSDEQKGSRDCGYIEDEPKVSDPWWGCCSTAERQPVTDVAGFCENRTRSDGVGWELIANDAPDGIRVQFRFTTQKGTHMTSPRHLLASVLRATGLIPCHRLFNECNPFPQPCPRIVSVAENEVVTLGHDIEGSNEIVMRKRGSSIGACLGALVLGAEEEAGLYVVALKGSACTGCCVGTATRLLDGGFRVVYIVVG